MSVRMRKRKPNPLLPDQRLGFTLQHSAYALDCGTSKIRDLVEKGQLELVYVDGMPRITGESLRSLMTLAV
jgi:hypothetical protein